MSSVDDLRVASTKTEEVQQLIKEQESKSSQNFYVAATSWGTAFGMICLLIVCICCSCCCKCCRNCFVWMWDRWSPKGCWRQTQDKCCVSIHNYNGTKAIYSQANTSPSPAVSIKSLPEVGNVVIEQPKSMKNDKLELQGEIEPLAIGVRKCFVKSFHQTR
jgi:hypothetical protein